VTWDRRALPASLAALTAVLLVGAAMVSLWQRLEVADHRRIAADVASSAAFALEQQLASSMAAPHALAAVVRHDGEVRDFERIAAELLPLYPGVDSLQLAPDSVLRHIFPLAGNEAALGLDLAHDPIQAPAVAAARETRRLVVSGPFRLRQGGVALVGRVAVYVRSPTGERFWGLAAAIIRLPRLLEAARLRSLVDQGYEYRLVRRDASGSEEPIDGSPAEVAAAPVEVAVRVAAGNWVLRVSPRAGWDSASVGAAGLLLSLLGGLAIAVLVYGVVRQPAVLRREVAARTAELERALAEQRAAQDALRQSQKLEAVGQLAGGIAHDFNNLLQAIRGYAAMAAAGPDLPPQLSDDLQQVLAATDRAAALTRQLLAFGRRQVLEPRHLDLNEVVADLMKMMGRIIGEHITLRLIPGHNLAAVWADRGQIEQVLMNLCVNARDAMPDGGTLTIESRNVLADEALLRTHPAAHPGRYVLLRVTDTGAGIAPSILEHVFEPFFTTKEVGKGTGLGLATVHGIVHQHQGMVHASSEPGHGTTFEVYLPAVEAAASATGTAIEAPVGGGTETILLAEDDPTVRSLAERILREAGYTVLVAEHGGQALAIGSDPGTAIDLAVLDVVMPKLTGRAVRDRLRPIRPGLRFLFASGYSDDAVHTDFIAQEGTRLLRKPYTREALLRAVRESLAAPVEGAGSDPRP
jgi:signal transduction histidine kinase/ActR/RegA family two-component response regulator